jgi:competence protein ComEC
LERHFDSVLRPSEAGLARALTLGQGRAVLPAARLAFRRTGTAHLLAVSGLHLSFATMIALGVLSFCLARIPWLARRFDTGKFAAAGAIAAAGAYACLSGGNLPATRAFVMLAAVLSGRLCHRPASSSSGLALASSSLLLHDPTSLCEPSFQLSFGAAAALVFFLAKRSTDDESEPRPAGMRARVLEALAQLVRVSLAATAVTTPIALWHFRELSLVAVPVNLIAVPIASLVLVPGLLICCVLVPIWPAAAVLLTRCCGALVGLFTDCLEALSQGSIAIAEPGPAVIACAVTACAAAALVAIWPRRSSALVLGLACGACGLSIILSTDKPPQDALVLDALDVGHGDSLLLTLPSGEHLLVDTGGSRDPAYDTGERIVVPALRSLGVSSLAALVLTHEDHDHVGGARAVLRGFSLLQLWHNGAAFPGDAQAAAVAAANSSGTLVKAPPSLCGLHRIGNATITVLHPCDVPTIDQGGNDRSLVLLVEHEASRLLLLGDIGAQVERDLVSRGLVPPVDVLKVAHHGSKTSTSDELLEAASPRYALVSEPRHEGRIGLHRDTAQRLESAGAILLSTGKRGALRIVLDGRGIAVRPL